MYQPAVTCPGPSQVSKINIFARTVNIIKLKLLFLPKVPLEKSPVTTSTWNSAKMMKLWSSITYRRNEATNPFWYEIIGAFNVCQQRMMSCIMVLNEIYWNSLIHLLNLILIMNHAQLLNQVTLSRVIQASIL